MGESDEWIEAVVVVVGEAVEEVGVGGKGEVVCRGVVLFVGDCEWN